MRRNKQILAKIGSRMYQFKNKVNMVRAKEKISKYYHLLQKKKMILPIRTIKWLNKKRDLALASWGYFFYIVSQFSTTIDIYASIQQMRDPIQKIQAIYPGKIRRLQLLNGHVVELKADETPLHDDSNLIYCVSPQNQDELTNLVQFSSNHQYCIISGSFTQIPQRLLINKDQDDETKNFIVFNMDKMKKFSIDAVNNQIKIDVGCKCSQINKVLQQSGYQKLFFTEMDNYTIYKIINQNIPLKTPYMHQLGSAVLNIDIVSPQGQNYRSAPDVDHHGVTPNLNSFFLGSQARYGIPCSVTIKLCKKYKNIKEQQFIIKNYNISQTISTLRTINQLLEPQLMVEKQFEKEGNVYKIKTLNISENMKLSLNKISQLQQNKNVLNSFDKANIIFSINWSIIEKLLLDNSINPFNFKLNGSVLRCYLPLNQMTNNKNDSKIQRCQQMRNIISKTVLEGGILIWCQNEELYNKMKTTGQGVQIGSELMEKMYKIRLTMDPKKTLFSRDREEIYYTKSLFRRISQVFW